MNKDLQAVLNLIQQSEHLSGEEKKSISKSLKDADKELEITSFKLDRTEKVKRTTAILLEETIEELENKRKAVEAQNHELEIESCLERVRTVALSMNKPDDMLQVCHIISEQLELLKVKEIRNIQTAIFYKDKGTYMNYEYYAKHNKTIITETTYTNNEIHEAFAEKMQKGNGEFYITHIKGAEVKDWIAYQKTTNVFIDDYLYTASSLNYYWYSLGPVALGISTYEPLTGEETNLFKRFLKVFELSYRRYLDIEKAAAQAQEAKVEASLEKVRAVAMSMNKPDDLLNICETLYKEFNAFGFTDLRNAMINIHNDEDKTFVNYDYSDTIGKSTNHLLYDIHPVIEKQVKQVRSANDAFSETVFAGKDLTAWKKFRKKIGEKDDPRIKKTKALYYYFYSTGTGAIGISTFSAVSEDKLKLLKRYRNVFNLSYQRYTDLALAEAQARESQIELGLERVRARAMAMQKSDELAELVDTVFKELTKLDFALTWCIINIIDESSLSNTVWAANPDIEKAPESYYMKFEDYAFHHAMMKGWKERKIKDVYVLKGQEKKIYDEYLFNETEFRRVPVAAQAASKAMEKYVVTFSFSNFGGLQTVGDAPLSDANLDILSRFGKVFDLTYTRFNDLKQAEAQARESQIQLALERVRARTMAMQKSDELAETASVLFKQLIDLGIKPAQMRTCAITTLKTDEPIGECWITSPDGSIIPQPFMVPYDETSAYKTIYAAWKSGEKFLVVNLSGDALLQHLNFLKKYARIPTQQFQALPDQPKETFTHAMFFSQGYLFIISNEPLPAYHEIFKRFGAIFQQTYTRFLDLKKAEDQARESQIQLALERVRARTMAMQKSDELAETVFILFQQFKQLGENPDQATIGIINEDERVIEYWVTMYGNQTNRVYKFSIDEPNVTNRIYHAWKEQKKSLVIDLSGKELYDFATYRESMGGAAYYPEEKRRVINVAFFSKGIINVQSNKSRSEESIRLLERFAAVFEQTYTRFLDLQKAEAQARESQIQLALERVRARTMAMQHSDELKEAAALLFQQAKALGVPAYSCGYNIWEKDENKFTSWMGPEDGSTLNPVFNIPLTEDANFIRYATSKQNGEQFFVLELRDKRMQEHYEYLKTIPAFKAYFDYAISAGFNLPETQIHHVANFSQGNLLFITLGRCPEFHDVFKRFAAVFEQTYTRFLDLQKAEAQTREAQIEASLERLRSKTMAMHNSADVGETAAVMVDELKRIGVETIRCGIGIMHEPGDMEVWTIRTGEDDKTDIIIGLLDMNIHPLLHGAFENWRNKNESYSYELKGDDLLNYYNAVNHYPGYPIRYDTSSLPALIHHNEFYFAEGTLFSFSLAQLLPEQRNIFKRFAGVFGQTYRRYLDLKKAEAQTREAKIEAAMEKVRSRAMAMQKPNELVEVAQLLRKEMNGLGVEELETSSIYIHHEDTQKTECWYAIKDVQHPEKELVSDHMNIDLHDTSVGRQMLAFYRSDQKQVSIAMQGASRKEWINYCADHSKVLVGFYGDNIPDRTYHLYKFSNGYIGAASPGEISSESWDLLQRATSVFSLAYTRFSDLQQAEAQTREAQIELALERVRARTMAMFRSEELAETAAVLFHQLIGLGIIPNRLFIGIINDDSGDIEAWATDETGIRLSRQFVLSSNRNNSVKKMYDGWKTKKKSVLIDVYGKELEDYLHYLNDEIHVPFTIGLDQKRRVQHIAYFSKGLIGMTSPEEQPASTINLLEKFAGVFNLTYTRFLDLQRAELQAKEATIEAALERVRGKAMAMRNSDDLSFAASMVFTELRKLGINPIRSGVGIISKESRRVEFYSAMSSANGDSLSLTGGVIMSGHPEFEKQYESWLRKENHFVVLKGEELRSYYKFLFAGLNIDSDPNNENDQEQYGHWLMFSEGFLFAWSDKAYTETEIDILDRFKKIVELTFRRYIELQKSEINAREAVKQAALDRVRADIASMRTTDDLEKITPLIWNELNIIGIPFIRCGVFIMDEHLEQIHTFLSTPDGKAIAAFHIPYATPGNIQQVLAHWQQKASYISHWDELSFKEFADTLVKQGALASSTQYLQTIPQGGFYLHFLPFLQGMLYVGNSAQLKTEEIELIQSVADAFSTAYARYEDFNKLEAAKQTVEKTLVDLKQAQTQLVQSEKMASLGELTAGIAHEIQNPLNFVNNFSEVSNELIEELRGERLKAEGERNMQLEDELLKDIAQNLEKINHHGKRADGIVKGMLQHSRSSTSVKEQTDINKLADEYLRLAYHGLRAKDKSFNATLKTDYDETIGTINIVPQDIGRVVLNLITNAFYAVAERKKNNTSDYEPTVTIATRSISSPSGGRGVTIKVSDNGGGIPSAIVDKIFQPFFTTKPTGQGTGLGLSLAYDIVKTHGGELRVETRESEGTTFTIQLPMG